MLWVHTGTFSFSIPILLLCIVHIINGDVTPMIKIDGKDWWDWCMIFKMFVDDQVHVCNNEVDNAHTLSIDINMIYVNS